MAGDFAAALHASQQAERLLRLQESMLEEATYHFYGALSRAACCDSVSPDERRQHLEVLAHHHRQLEIWAKNCPENFENRAALVGAEIARIEGRVLEAEQLYEQAIRSAQSNGIVNHEAIAYEVAARFYAARGFQRFANAYLLEARYCYQRWGRMAKYGSLIKSTPTSAPKTPRSILDPALTRRSSTWISRWSWKSPKPYPAKSCSGS